ncbi:MAG: exonuclease domain-containing protein [Pirellulales bacterium]
MDFVAIDFETANHRANSACQLAAVVVRESQIVDEHCWLIRPPSNQFSRFNIAVHGIRPADVAKAPNMAAIWPEFQSVMQNQILVAHNARFDVSVLLSSLGEYSIGCPDFEFHCTRMLARAAWPGRPRYGLKPLGVWLGLNFKHHDALEDARVCAKIALRVESMFGQVDSFEALETKLTVRRGKHRTGSVSLPRGSGSSGGGRIQRSDRWGFPIASQQKQVGSICPETVKQSCVDKPLREKRIVMLAPLRGLSWEATIRLLTDLGATIQTEIDATTNYVVAAGITVSGAQQQVDAIRAASSKPTAIRVLSERQFRALLPGGAVSIS